MFSEPTTNPMRLDRPVVDDISAIGEAESDLRRGDRGAVVGVRGDEQPAAARVPGVEPGLKVAAVSGCNGCRSTRRAAASTTGVSRRIPCIRARVRRMVDPSGIGVGSPTVSHWAGCSSVPSAESWSVRQGEPRRGLRVGST